MIKDKLRNRHLYKGLPERLQAALDFLEKGCFTEEHEAVMEISGSDIYAVYKKYETSEKEEEAEAHRKYIDIHFAVNGSEKIFYVNSDYAVPCRCYDEEEDCSYFTEAAEMLVLHEGEFAVFFPEDVHMPGVRNEQDLTVEKVLVKVIL